ncbi:MAG: EamA family transporter [Clostridiales bacterium]|nr:EamA family transporter [Clostridiales bacterium]
MDNGSLKLRERWPEGLILLQSIIYGFGDPISKIAMEVTPVYTMMTVRYSMAFLVCFLMFRKRIIETLKTVPIRAWLIPGVCIGLSYLLNNVALSMTDATSVAFLRSLSVVITPAFAFLIYKNKYKWQHILIQVLVLPGMYLLCVRGGLSGFGAGEVIALLAAALMAGALVFSKNYLDTVDPVSMTALQAACSALLAFAGSLIVEGGIHLENTTPVAWLIIVYLAVLCTFLGYLMQNLALTRIDGRTVSLIQCICPVMTAIFAFIMLGEHLSTAGIIGAIIIVGCIIAGAKN